MTNDTVDSNLRVFQAIRIISSHKEKIKASPQQIYPLLCPIQEYKWIDKWQCEMVYSDSGVIENNCIFKEERTGPLLFGLKVPTYWIVSLYDPENFRIQFVLFTGDMIVSKLDVEVKDLGNGVSSIKWSFTITSLNKEANRYIDANTKNKADIYLTVLSKSLKHYCETGKMLRLNKASILKMGLSTGIRKLLKSHFNR